MRLKTKPQQPAKPRAITPVLSSAVSAIGKSKAVPAPTPAPKAIECSKGAVWRMSGKHSVAYVSAAALACELLGVDTKRLAERAMAVYCDKKGRAFAWQIRFDAEQWDAMVRRMDGR